MPGYIVSSSPSDTEESLLLLLRACSAALKDASGWPTVGKYRPYHSPSFISASYYVTPWFKMLYNIDSVL